MNSIEEEDEENKANLIKDGSDQICFDAVVLKVENDEQQDEDMYCVQFNKKSGDLKSFINIFVDFESRMTE